MSKKSDFISGFKFAIRGVSVFFKSERNARMHLAATLIVVLMGLTLKVSLIEWSLLTLTIALVLTAEAINTAIENLVDMVSPERKPQAGLIKDISAGAVLISALGAAIVGLIIFGPKIIDWFNQ